MPFALFCRASQLSMHYYTTAVEATMEDRFIPWKNVTLGPKDPILGITEAFRADQAPEKVNLGVGAYRDDDGKPFVLECVKKAELMMTSIYKDKRIYPNRRFI